MLILTLHIEFFKVYYWVENIEGSSYRSSMDSWKDISQVAWRLGV